MSEAKYDLVINRMPEGADAEALKKHISTVCKLAPAAVDMAIGELMTGLRKAVLVRKHLPQPVAEELKAALESIGLVCTLIAPLGLVAREVTVEKKEYVCPACDHRQPYTDVQDDAPCANCGVIRSKYLNNEQTRKAIERERRLREARKQIEIEQHLREEDAREQEQIEARVRKQLGRERGTNRITRVAGVLRSTSVPARAAGAILLIGVFSSAYLLRAKLEEDADAKVASGPVPTALSVVPDGATDQHAPGESAASASRGKVSGNGGPGTVSHSPQSDVKSEVSIHVSSGDGKGGPGSHVETGLSTDSAGGLKGTPVGAVVAVGVAVGERFDTMLSTVTTEPPGAGGDTTGGNHDASTLSRGGVSTATPDIPSIGSVPSMALTGGATGIGLSEARSGWRATMQQALNVARNIGNASERAKSLAVLASVYIEMGDIRAAEETSAEAMHATTSIEVTDDFAGALSKVTKARSELWTAIALSQRDGADGAGIPEGVIRAMETARSIPGIADRTAGLSNVAKYLALAGHASQAEVLFKELLVAARDMADVGKSMSTRADIAGDLVEVGNIESARGIGDRMWEDAKRIADVRERVEALSTIAVTVSAWEGGMTRAEELLAEVRRLGEAFVDPTQRARVKEAITLKRVQSLSLHAGVLAAAGKENDARSALEEAMSLVDKIADPADRVVALGSIVEGQGAKPVRRSTARLLTVDPRIDEAVSKEHESGASREYSSGSGLKEEMPLTKK